MKWKKLGKALLFPHISVLLLLLPTAAVWLCYGFLHWAETEPLRIGSYVLAFYTLTVWCARLPRLVGRGRRFKSENPYAQTWLNDTRLRTNVTLTASVLWNGAYALFQLGLGIYHRSPWFFSLAGYYLSLALMRFFLVRHTVRYEPRQELRRELNRYRVCGWVFLLMNVALSAMMFYMIRENRAVRHSEIVTIALAAYTFTSLTMAIVNLVKYRAYQSPVLSASKAISLASACVSMLTLEATMLTTFGGEGMTAGTRLLFLALSGGGVSLFIVAMSVYMIKNANEKLKRLENEYGAE